MAPPETIRILSCTDPITNTTGKGTTIMRKSRLPLNTNVVSQRRDPQRDWMPELSLQTVTLDSTRWSERARLQSRWFTFDLSRHSQSLH